MSQLRIQDYGSPVVAQTIKTLVGSLVHGAVLEGNTFIVIAPDKMQVRPGKAVTHQGVILIEDEPKNLQVVNTTNPVDYTVYYSHVDEDISGGVPAELVIEAGLLEPSVVQGVILGYVRYPGSGVPLNPSFFILSPKVGVGIETPTIANADFTFPINNNYMVTASGGGVLDVNPTYDIVGPQMYLKIRNNSLSLGNKTLTFPFKVYDVPYHKLQLILGVDINATVSPIFIDSVGTAHSLLIAPLTGLATLNAYTIDLPGSTQQNINSVVYVQLQIACSVNREIKLQAIGLNPYNLPV